MSGTQERHLFNKRDWWLFKQSLDIKNRYRDGEPLNDRDKAFILELLQRHPKGREKFGDGVRDVIVGPYILNTRCFFVVRSNGAIEDFSIRKCLGAPAPRRNERVLTLMRTFTCGRLLGLYRKGLETRKRSLPDARVR